MPESARRRGRKMVGSARRSSRRSGARAALPARRDAVLGVRAARRGHPEADAWLARIADARPASLAITDARGSWEPEDCGVTARSDSTDIVLSARTLGPGRIQGRPARRLGAPRERFRAVRSSNRRRGRRARPRPIHDLTRDQATVRLRAVARAAREAEISRGSRCRAAARLALVAGRGRRRPLRHERVAVTATVGAPKRRRAVDAEIGFFQASAKRPLVNAMIEIDRARSAALPRGACCIDTGDEGAEGRGRRQGQERGDTGRRSSRTGPSSSTAGLASPGSATYTCSSSAACTTGYFAAATAPYQHRARSRRS